MQSSKPWNTVVSLALIVAIVIVASALFNAQTILLQTNWFYFALSNVFFLLGIAVWVYAWGYLIRKKFNVSWVDLFFVGFSSVYGALAPMQLGAEALRSMQLKQFHDIPLKESISCSAVVKGTKFLVTGIAAILALWFLVSQHAYLDELAIFLIQGRLDALLVYSILSGFLVIALASALFLIPLRARGFQRFIQWVDVIAQRFPFLQKLSHFFESYQQYARSLPIQTIAFILFLATVSWTLELVALQFAFISLNAFIELDSLLLLAVLISILEKAPLTPRGLGLVELVSFQFLAYNSSVTLSSAQIVAVLLLFGVIRVIVPTALSVLLNLHGFRRAKN